MLRRKTTRQKKIYISCIGLLMCFPVCALDKNRAEIWVGADSNILKTHVYYLSDDRLQGRLTGSFGDSLAAWYIGEYFQSQALQTLTSKKIASSPLDYWQSYSMKAKWNEILHTRNVVGLLEGSDSLLKKSYVVIGAHFDHLGLGDKANSSMRKGVIAVHNGADDNASGVAGMLELLRYFSVHPTKKSLIFVAFSGEEIGLCGSKAFLDSLPFEKKQIDAMFNLDMLGGQRGSSFKISGSGTSKQSLRLIKESADLSPLGVTTSPFGHGPSDHANFYAQKIPVFFFATTPTSTYHTPEDDAETLSYSGMALVTDLAANLIGRVGNLEENLVYTASGAASNPTMGNGKMKITLGLMPDINSSSKKGLSVMLVVEGKPAYKAGIRSGDIILSINSKKVRDIEGYMQILKKTEPKQIIKVKIRRGADIYVYPVQV
ncbi:MAG: M20/M25/M40 family metallo-hydrolase [Bacteroidales bacterium]